MNLESPPPASGSEPAGLYIHVPFCKTKCPYCDFYSVTDLSLVESWLDALGREMCLYDKAFHGFDSLYIGGGTPTLLDKEQIKRLVNSAKSHFAFSRDTEVTIEANPDDITIDRLELLLALGVNRLSIGVQSFNGEDLAFLRRRHSAHHAEEAVKLAKAAGFTNFGIDLMYGFDGQTIESWHNTIEKAVSFKPPHLSCYQFTLEGETPFAKLKTEGRMKSITEKEEKDFFLFTSDFLKQKGYIHYEVSNFADGKSAFSRHNRKYWRHVPYLGIGPAAHSFAHGERWWNCRSVEKYCRLLSRWTKPVEGSEKLTEEQLRLERLYLGFRTENGVSMRDACCESSTTKSVLQLKRSGFVKIRRNRVVPTQKGYLIADRLPLMCGR